MMPLAVHVVSDQQQPVLAGCSLIQLKLTIHHAVPHNTQQFYVLSSSHSDI